MSIFENTVMVKQKRTPASTAIILVCWVAMIFCIGAVFIWFIPAMILPAMLMGLALYVANRQSQVEYEYTYIEGQLDIARIIAKSKRKSVAVIDMDEELLMIAPEGNREISNYERDNTIIRKDCSTRLPDHKKYKAIYKAPKGLTIVTFEPDENLLDKMRIKYARKVLIG